MWNEKEKEKHKRILEERTRFLAMSNFEAEQMSVSEQYERIRYLRQLEAQKYVDDLRKEAAQANAPVQKYYGKKITYGKR